MSWRDLRKAAVESAMELSAPNGKNTLVFYLVSRFIVVLVLIVAAESAIVWIESVTLLPLLQTLTPSEARATFDTTSLVSLLTWMGSLLVSILNAGSLPLGALPTRSLAVLLALVMLIALLAPLLAGAAVFSTMIERRIRMLSEQRERELRKMDQQRSQFITDIAHDLRTPLMAISGMSHALEDGMVRDEAQREEYLHAICERSDKMGELVSTVFDYTKLDTGSFALNRSVVDLSQLLLNETALAYTAAEEAGMQLTSDIPEARCAIYADPVQIARVVTNLIANATLHNEPGTEVAVILVRQAAVAFVLVADTGVPIPGNPEDLFEPFVQGDYARSSQRKGSGLGLAICKRIAAMHGYPLSVVQPYGRFSKAFVLQCSVCE